MSKPKGYVKHILAIDCETTGLCFGTDHPTHNQTTGETHQALSWGVIVIESDTMKTVEELYVEIKWNDESKKQREADPKFGTYAENIHGLSQEYLEEHGVTEEEAVLAIGSLIMKYWGPESCINLLGHNVHLFDLDFFRAMFKRHEVYLKFGNRHYDTNSIGWAAFDIYTSDELFSLIGFDARGNHNALEDIKMTVEAARTVRTIVQNALKEK